MTGIAAFPRPGFPTPPTTSTWPAGCCGGPATSSGLAVFIVLFVQWVRSSMKEAEREDRRLDLLESRGGLDNVDRREP